jgi:hypothetical protein
VSLNLLCCALVSQCAAKTGPVSCVRFRGRVPGRGGVGVVLTVSVWGVLTEFDDLSWTPEIEAASGQHGGCPEESVGTVVAGFGAVKQLREGEEARRTRLGYSFIVKEREGKALTITPKHGVTEGCMAHAINHTCHPGFANCRFVHAGIVGGWSEDEQGGIGGRRTSEVFVKTTRRVESDAELFANYGTKFRFAGGCVCHSCRPIEP